MFDKLNFFTHSLGIKILNFKQVGMNVLVLIILLAVVESGDKITGTVIPIFSFLRRLAIILRYQDVTSENCRQTQTFHDCLFSEFTKGELSFV